MTSSNHNPARGDTLSFILKTDLSELDQLHAKVKEFGQRHQLPTKIIFETNLALEELFTNIASYGHEQKGGHLVRFSMEYNRREIHIRVEDDGVPFNLLEAKPVDLATDLEERIVGGLGIHLIRNLMDDVRYQRANETNITTMRKSCR